MRRQVGPARFHRVRRRSCRAADQEKTVASPSQKLSKIDLSSLTLAACAAALLAACGGGSSPDAATPPPVVPAALTLGGTAATGAALAMRPIEAKCAGGTSAALATATTEVDGKFSVVIAGGALPCVLRVTTADGVLHSLATGTGAIAAANITPASELVLAHLVGGPAAGAFSSFDATSLTDAKVQAALIAVGDMLKAAGVDVAAIGNLLTAPLVAAHGSTAGNDFDKALDALKVKMDASKTKLTELAEAVAKVSPNLPLASVSSVSSTPSLPAAQLLQPAAANCAALRSGRYRLVVNAIGDGNAPATEVITIDASKLTATNAAGEVNQLTANGPCRYRTPSNADAVVSPAGVIVAQIGYGPQGAALKGGVLFPEQTHPLASLAGEWNLIGLDRTVDNGPIHLTAATGSIGANGKLTALSQCDNVVNCVAGTTAELAKLAFSANTAGGFDFSYGDPTDISRVFGYRSGGGELVWVMLSKNGHIQFATRKVALTLPTVGRVSESFSLTLTPQYTAPFAISESKNTIVSVDATANSFLRDAVINLTTGVTRPERFAINQPREGYSRRTGESVVDSAGQPSTVQAFVVMALRGTGVTPVAFLGNNQLVLSVNKP